MKKKMTFAELEKAFMQWNKEHGLTQQFQEPYMKGVIVFTADSFDKEYSEASRSYEVISTEKYFLPYMLGRSLYGNSLDGSDVGVRLDYYMSDWKVDYCYIVEE